MDLFNIILDNKKFSYIDSITLGKHNYVAFMDDDNIFVSEYIIDNGDIIFDDVDDLTYDKVLKELNLE